MENEFITHVTMCYMYNTFILHAPNISDIIATYNTKIYLGSCLYFNYMF